MLCSTSYWSNTEIQSLNKLNAGGPSLAPCPTVYTVQGRLHGVAVPIGTLFNLPNRLLSTYILGTRRSRSLPSSERGLISVQFAHTTTMQSCACSVVAWQNGMASLLRYASYPGHFLTHFIVNWKLFFVTMLELEAPLSSFLEEVLYKFLNEWILEWINEGMNEWITNKPLYEYMK